MKKIASRRSLSAVPSRKSAPCPLSLGDLGRVRGGVDNADDPPSAEEAAWLQVENTVIEDLYLGHFNALYPPGEEYGDFGNDAARVAHSAAVQGVDSVALNAMILRGGGTDSGLDLPAGLAYAESILAGGDI